MQITLKRDYIYKIENTDLEIGVSVVFVNLLNIMIQRTLLRGRGTYIIMKFNESNKKVKRKQELMWSRTQDVLVVNYVPKPLD